MSNILSIDCNDLKLIYKDTCVYNTSNKIQAIGLLPLNIKIQFATPFRPKSTFIHHIRIFKLELHTLILGISHLTLIHPIGRVRLRINRNLYSYKKVYNRQYIIILYKYITIFSKP